MAPFGTLATALSRAASLALLEMNRILLAILTRFRIEFDDPHAIEPMLGVVIRVSTPVIVRIARRDRRDAP